MADVPNFFPDEELEMQVVIARRVLQELYADGWMRLVRVNELGMPPEGEELGSPEVEEVIAKMAPHPGPPTGDNLLVQLVPTEKTETWIKKLVAEERGRARERGDDRR
jgi:hypothetical protein